MLTDQTFYPLPLVLIGPELFYSNDHALRFDVDRILAFREHVEGFTFIYAALLDSKYGDQRAFFKRLLGMGAGIQESIIIDSAALDDAALRENIGKLFLKSELIFSPEFLEAFTKQGVPYTNRRSFSNFPKAFLDALVHFSGSLEPFSIERFLIYYNERIGLPHVKL